ncbi:MAG: IS66 family transposase [Candidatus Bipolaricaulia bacterium]
MKLEQSSNSDQEPEDKELAQMSRPALIQEVRRLRKENKLLREKVAQLEEKLERVTDKLEKGNVPDFKPNKDQPEDSSDPGRKKGHQGESREASPSEEVDEEKTLDPDLCPQCGKSFQDQKPQETRTRYVEDILLPRPWRVKYEINRYYCSDCEELVEEKSEDVSPGGRLGNKLRSYILYLREELRLPDNIVKKHLDTVGISLSEATVENVTSQGADALEDTYQGYKEEIRESPGAYVDETGLRVDGVNGWLWTGATPKETFFHPSESRGSKVVDKLLGEDYKGTMVSDFYSAYSPPDLEKQKCWTHLLRDSRELESEDGKKLHAKLKGIHNRAKKGEGSLNENSSSFTREYFAYVLEKEIGELAERFLESEDEETTRLAKRLKKYKDQLFTFVRSPPLEDTNNIAERALRPQVVKRKISGGHRSWSGARNHAILMSVLATCKKRNESFMETVEGALKSQFTSEN